MLQKNKVTTGQIFVSKSTDLKVVGKTVFDGSKQAKSSIRNRNTSVNL